MLKRFERMSNILTNIKSWVANWPQICDQLYSMNTKPYLHTHPLRRVKKSIIKDCKTPHLRGEVLDSYGHL